MFVKISWLLREKKTTENFIIFFVGNKNANNRQQYNDDVFLSNKNAKKFLKHDSSNGYELSEEIFSPRKISKEYKEDADTAPITRQYMSDFPITGKNIGDNSRITRQNIFQPPKNENTVEDELTTFEDTLFEGDPSSTTTTTTTKSSISSENKVADNNDGSTATATSSATKPETKPFETSIKDHSFFKTDLFNALDNPVTIVKASKMNSIGTNKSFNEGTQFSTTLDDTHNVNASKKEIQDDLNSHQNTPAVHVSEQATTTTTTAKATTTPTTNPESFPILTESTTAVNALSAIPTSTRRSNIISAMEKQSKNLNSSLGSLRTSEEKDEQPSLGSVLTTERIDKQPSLVYHITLEKENDEANPSSSSLTSTELRSNAATIKGSAEQRTISSSSPTNSNFRSSTIATTDEDAYISKVLDDSNTPSVQSASSTSTAIPLATTSGSTSFTETVKKSTISGDTGKSFLGTTTPHLTSSQKLKTIVDTPEKNSDFNATTTTPTRSGTNSKATNHNQLAPAKNCKSITTTASPTSATIDKNPLKALTTKSKTHTTTKGRTSTTKKLGCGKSSLATTNKPTRKNTLSSTLHNQDLGIISEPSPATSTTTTTNSSTPSTDIEEERSKTTTGESMTRSEDEKSTSENLHFSTYSTLTKEQEEKTNASPKLNETQNEQETTTDEHKKVTSDATEGTTVSPTNSTISEVLSTIENKKLPTNSENATTTTSVSSATPLSSNTITTTNSTTSDIAEYTSTRKPKVNDTTKVGDAQIWLFSVPILRRH